MKRLGGDCIELGDASNSSVSKGESLADTAKMFESYCDAIVIRHDLEGVSRFLSDIVDVPIINAGDGAGQHPTQKYGRTVHSLAYALGMYDVEMTFVSPDELKMPKETLHDLENNNIKYKETNRLKDVIDDVDVLYVTRIQKERFPDVEEYERIKGAYLINRQLLEGKDLIVMHPLPRIDEIAYDVDETEYNKYFEQAANAIPVRMAILRNLITHRYE